jgi:hypothetical protein
MANVAWDSEAIAVQKDGVRTPEKPASRPPSAVAHEILSLASASVEAVFPSNLDAQRARTHLAVGYGASAGSTAILSTEDHAEILPAVAPILLRRGPARQKRAGVHCGSRRSNQGSQEHQGTPRSFFAADSAVSRGAGRGVEYMFAWHWLADLRAQEQIPFVLGHALYMKAIHGGKAKNDRIDSQKIALLAKGGMLPIACA